MTKRAGIQAENVRKGVSLSLVKGRGRPFRFLAIILILWAGGRIIIRYAETNPPHPKQSTIAASRPIAGQQKREHRDQPRPLIPAALNPVTVAMTPVAGRSTHALAVSTVPPSLAKHAPYSQAMPPPSPLIREREKTPQADGSNLPPPPFTPSLRDDLRPQSTRLWSASAWMLWREKAALTAIGNHGQLGGAQAGIRVERYIGEMTPHVPVRVYGRLSRALQQTGAAEGAVGISIAAIQGTMPLSLHGERRIRLEQGGRNAFALFMTSGINPTTITGDLMLEGYAQAGIAGLSRRDGFVDGRISITAPLRTSTGTGTGTSAPRVGISLSGGAQPDISRLDIGPVLEWRLPVAGQQPRLMMEWRQRISGDARPGSGPAITIATDF